MDFVTFACSISFFEAAKKTFAPWTTGKRLQSKWIRRYLIWEKSGPSTKYCWTTSKIKNDNLTTHHKQQCLIRKLKHKTHVDESEGWSFPASDNCICWEVQQRWRGPWQPVAVVTFFSVSINRMFCSFLLPSGGDAYQSVVAALHHAAVAVTRTFALNFGQELIHRLSTIQTPFGIRCLRKVEVGLHLSLTSIVDPSLNRLVFLGWVEFLVFLILRNG